PLDLRPYQLPVSYAGSSKLLDGSLRGSGPLPSLPWGVPRLTAGIEYRAARTPERTTRTDYPITILSSNVSRFYQRKSETGSAYLEATVPLVKRDWLAGVHALDLQLTGRGERFRVDAG